MAQYFTSWFSNQPSWLITVEKWQGASSFKVNILKTVIHFCADVRSVIQICIIDLIQAFLFFQHSLEKTQSFVRIFSLPYLTTTQRDVANTSELGKMVLVENANVHEYGWTLKKKVGLVKAFQKVQ